MPLENLEEEGLPKNPDLRIAQLRFLLSLQPQSPDPAVRKELMAAILRHGERRSAGETARAEAWQPGAPEHVQSAGKEAPCAS